MEDSKMLLKGGGIIIVGRGIPEIMKSAIIITEEGLENNKS